jgi:hypothetical protein
MVAVTAAFAAIAGGQVQAGQGLSAGNETAMPAQATLYKSPWCGCCKGYVAYLEGHDISVDVRDLEDLDTVKRMAGVPEDLQSCHTMRIGNYTVEGHVPMDVVRHLFDEQLEVTGITAPGMPAGAPGMGGEPEAYTVYGFSAGQAPQALMTIDPH